MSKEIEHYQQMVQLLKKQLSKTSSDDNAEQYMHYKQQLSGYNKLIAAAKHTKTCVNNDSDCFDNATVDWDEDR